MLSFVLCFDWIFGKEKLYQTNPKRENTREIKKKKQNDTKGNFLVTYSLSKKYNL